MAAAALQDPRWRHGRLDRGVVAAHPTASYDPIFLKDIAQFYDEGTIVRYRNGDAFVKQVYEQLKPRS